MGRCSPRMLPRGKGKKTNRLLLRSGRKGIAPPPNVLRHLVGRVTVQINPVRHGKVSVPSRLRGKGMAHVRPVRVKDAPCLLVQVVAKRNIVVPKDQTARRGGVVPMVPAVPVSFRKMILK